MGRSKPSPTPITSLTVLYAFTALLGSIEEGDVFCGKTKRKTLEHTRGVSSSNFFSYFVWFFSVFPIFPSCSCALQNSLLNGNKTVVELLHCCSDMTCISLMFSLHSIAFFWSAIISQRNFLLSFDISQGQHTWLIWRISEASCLRHRTSYFLATFFALKNSFFLSLLSLTFLDTCLCSS